MSKAILVIDTPKSCNECLIYNSSEMLCCGGKVRAKEINTIPSWCPLKPLPNKVSHSEIEEVCGYWEVEGYNQCLKEILGEEE